jgi:dTDP-4-dehydrorhamnose 3,5-epimerase
MVFRATNVDGAFVIELERQEDERGYFARAFDKQELARRGLVHEFVQGNVAFNRRRGTLRGLHYQLEPHAEVKLVRCTRGAAFDVALDLRPASPTAGQWTAVELAAESGSMLYIPAGCAHGYETLVDETELFYLTSAAYAPESERGVRWDDPSYRIDWPDLDPKTISLKDRSWPTV